MTNTDDKDRDELARIIVGERYSGRRYAGSNPLENPLDARLVDRILDSDWLKEKLRQARSEGITEGRNFQQRRQSGW